MPEDMTIRFTVTRAVNAEKEIHIEAQGVLPTVPVPVTFESLFETGDLLLQAAEEHLTNEILGELIDGENCLSAQAAQRCKPAASSARGNAYAIRRPCLAIA